MPFFIVLKQIRRHLVALRDFYLKRIKWRSYSIGTGFHAGRNVSLWAKHHIIIGKNCYLGRYTSIECDALIGDHVLIANNVSFVGRYDHQYDLIGVPVRIAPQIRDADYDWKGLQSKITIQNDVWIGNGSIIVSGVTIGAASIVGAGSVVVRDVAPGSIVAGNPAKIIGQRFRSSEDLEKHLETIKS
jgi:acetyltransferase-like isoleucine patch superfamily enzyme